MTDVTYPSLECYSVLVDEWQRIHQVSVDCNTISTTLSPSQKLFSCSNNAHRQVYWSLKKRIKT